MKYKYNVPDKSIITKTSVFLALAVIVITASMMLGPMLACFCFGMITGFIYAVFHPRIIRRTRSVWFKNERN